MMILETTNRKTLKVYSIDFIAERNNVVVSLLAGYEEEGYPVLYEEMIPIDEIVCIKSEPTSPFKLNLKNKQSYTVNQLVCKKDLNIVVMHTVNMLGNYDGTVSCRLNDISHCCN